MPTDPDAPSRIYFVDQETGKVKKQKEFTVWLEFIVKKVVRGIRHRPLNEQNVWSVQFSFSTTSFSELVKLLSSVDTVEITDDSWQNEDTSPADVTSTDRCIKFNADHIVVGRLEDHDWESPRISFNLRELVLTPIDDSIVRKLNKLFMEKCEGYRLVDYGVQDIEELKKAERLTTSQ